MGTMPRLEQFDAEHATFEAIRSKDRYAFEEFVRRHDRWVRGVILGVLGDRDAVDDVAQQVWLTAWDRAGELRDVTRWRPWLYRLARNASLDAGRSRTRRRRQVESVRQALGSRTDEPPSESRAVDAEQHGAVMAAIQALPALYREPFVLRHVTGWSYQQIADLLDMPTDSVETRLVRARRLLRESLKDRLESVGGSVRPN